jgi:MOSC domain-containing protein YiiM
VFLQSRRSGFYFRVITVGDIGAGDAIERVSRDAAGISIHEAQDLAFGKDVDLARVAEAMAHPAVSAAWKKTLGKRMRG